MREDGAYVDRLLLTTNLSFTPTGNGPVESSRAAASPTFSSAASFARIAYHSAEAPTPVLRVVADGPRLELSYASNGLWAVEFSRDLKTWAALSALTNVSFSVEELDGVTRTVLRLHEPITAALFFRLVSSTR